MRQTIVIVAMILSACVGAERRPDDEQQIRAIHAGLDTALVAGDVAYFDGVFAPEFVFSHHFGYLVDRKDNIEYLKRLSQGQR